MSRKIRFLLCMLVLPSLLLAACQPQEAAEPAEAVVEEAEAVVEEAEPEEPEEKKLKVAWLLPGLISDGSYVTMAYQAVKHIEKQPYIEELSWVEGIASASDAEKLARDYIADGYDVVVANSGGYASMAMELAPQFPDVTFIALASEPEDNTLENVWFSGGEWEGWYFVSGALAAKMTETDVVGFIGGRDYALYAACAKAYEEGAKYVNPDIEVLSVFTGDFNDLVKGKEAGVSQIENGADVIIHTMNLGGFGLYQAAEEADKKVWTIGKDIDQFPMAPNTVLTTVLIDVVMQMDKIFSQIAAGVKGGYEPQDMVNGTVSLADFYGQVPDDIVAYIDELTEKVAAGEIEYTTQFDMLE